MGVIIYGYDNQIIGKLVGYSEKVQGCILLIVETNSDLPLRLKPFRWKDRTGLNDIFFSEENESSSYIYCNIDTSFLSDGKTIKDLLQ